MADVRNIVVGFQCVSHTRDLYYVSIDIARVFTPTKRLISPCLEGLILTHILQTEVKSKMSALKQGLQQEPAFPDGSPASRTIMGPCQIATQACDVRPDGAYRHGRRRLTGALDQHRQHQRLNHRIRG